MTFVPTAKDFSLNYDADHQFSFFESEDGEIFGFGHQDPQDLVSDLREYDRLTGGTGWEEDYDELLQVVRHTWAVIVSGGVDDDWRFQYGDKYEGEEGAFPLTILDRG